MRKSADFDTTIYFVNNRQKNSQYVLDLSAKTCLLENMYFCYSDMTPKKIWINLVLGSFKPKLDF